MLFMYRFYSNVFYAITSSQQGPLMFLRDVGLRRGLNCPKNMVAYDVWAIYFKSEVRCDLRGCLEAIVAAKPHFLCWFSIFSQ